MDVNALATQVARVAQTWRDSQIDKVERTGKLEYIAQSVPPNGVGNVQTIKLSDAFPLMEQWVGTRTFSEVFEDEITLTGVKWQKAYELDTHQLRQLNPENVAATAQKIGTYLQKAFQNGKPQKMWEFIRANGLAFDGQDFFDTTHTHLNGNTYSNLVDFTTARVAAAVPTTAEAQKEIIQGKLVLMNNSSNVVEYTEASEVEIMINVKSDAVFTAYERVRTQSVIDGDTNTLVGSFILTRDSNPGAGILADQVDFFMNDPSGFRALVQMDIIPLGGIDAKDETFSDHRWLYGQDAVFAWNYGAPWVACRLIAP